MNATAQPTQTVQQAIDLITWLTLPSAASRIPDAGVMAGWLRMLLDSCTPEECSEQLAQEVNAIAKIIKGAA